MYALRMQMNSLISFFQSKFDSEPIFSGTKTLFTKTLFTMKEDSCKKFINLVLTFGIILGLSIGSYQMCNWYGCNGWSAFLRSDLICNACVDVAYHLKNYQISLYGSVFTLITYKMSSFVNKAGAATETYIFEDYTLGKNSPRTLKRQL